jgi:hypothetical protein
MDAAAGGACDATISVDLTFTPLYEHYIGIMGPSKDCYTGASVEGTIQVATEGRSPISIPVKRVREPARGVQITECPGPAEAPFDGVWPGAVLAGLSSIWGEQAVLRAVSDPDPTIRQSAVLLLGQGASPDAVPAIIAALEDSVPEVRAAAASILGTVNPGAAGVVDALVGALADNSASVRASAVWSLGSLGPAAAPALEELMKLSGTGEDYERVPVIEAIGKIGPDAAPAIPGLTMLLSDPNDRLREAAAEALGGIGPAAVETVPKLIDLLGSEEWTVNRAAREALEAITGQRLGESPEPWRQWWETRE